MRTKLALPISVVALLLLTCLWIALYSVNPGPREHLGIGFLLGSLYGHSTLAAGWMALGPGGWPRLLLSLAWVIAFPCAFLINTILYIGAPDAGAIWVSAGMIFLLVQILAWPMRFWLGLRICKPSYSHDGNSVSLLSRQFGIQHLMIVTTIVAVVIGGGRLMLPFLLKQLAGHETAIFAFLVVAACIICIPIVFSILAMRKPALPTLVLLVLAAFATYIELPLLTKLGVGRGPDWLHLTLINAFSLLPVLFVSIALRLAGYQLSAATERQEYKSEAEVFVS